MCNITTNSFLIRNPAVSTCINGTGAVLFNADTSREKFINHTGLSIWKKMDGVSAPADITPVIAKDFDTNADNHINDDICDFATTLVKEGYAIASSTASTSPLPNEEYSYTRTAPQHIDISLTGKCNLKCKYCFYSNEMVGRADLPTEEWLRFFKELKSLGVRSVTLSGGEIFVRKDVWELIDAIIDARLKFSILTNGTLIDENTIAKFAENNRRRRLSSIQISIDGSCAEVHDKSRGKGSFDKAIRALCLLKKDGYPITSRITINRHNVDNLDMAVKLLLEDIGLYSISTNSAMPMGAGCSNQADISLHPQQQLQAMRTLQRLAKKYNERVTAAAGPLVKIEAYRDMERARLFGEKSLKWKMGTLSACGGAFMKMSVNHDGIITPCNMLPSAAMGQINKTPISSLWQDNPIQKKLRDRKALKTSEAKGCEGCEWAPYCNGSCPGLANELTGDFNSGNPHDCYRNFLKKISPEDRYNMFIQPVEEEHAKNINKP